MIPQAAEQGIRAINGKAHTEDPWWGNMRLSLYDVGLGQDYETTGGTNIIDGYWDIQIIGGADTASRLPSAQGEYRIFANNQDDIEVHLHNVDADGVDHATAMAAHAASESTLYFAIIYENVLYGPYNHTGSVSTSGTYQYRLPSSIVNFLNVGRDSRLQPAAANGTARLRVLAGNDMTIALRAKADGASLQYSEKDQGFISGPKMIPLADLKAEVAASTDFADFQSRIAAL